MYTCPICGKKEIIIKNKTKYKNEYYTVEGFLLSNVFKNTIHEETQYMMCKNCGYNKIFDSKEIKDKKFIKEINSERTWDICFISYFLSLFLIYNNHNIFFIIDLIITFILIVMLRIK